MLAGVEEEYIGVWSDEGRDRQARGWEFKAKCVAGAPEAAPEAGDEEV